MFKKIAIAVSLSSLSALTFAADDLDMTAVTAKLTLAAAAVGIVGSAVLLVWVGVKAYKFVKAAM